MLSKKKFKLSGGSPFKLILNLQLVFLLLRMIHCLSVLLFKMKQFSYKVMVRAHSEIFYDPGRVNRFFTKRKRKMTTMKFSTIMVVDEVTPTDYIGEFEDKVRATFLLLPFSCCPL